MGDPGIAPYYSAAGGANNITLDGNASTNVGSGGSVAFRTVTLSTTKTNDLIFICIWVGGAVVTGVSDTAGLTWTDSGLGKVGQVQVFSAFSTGILASDVITVTYNTTAAFDGLYAFALNGTATSSYFDPNVSLPASTATATPISGISTSNARDFIFAWYAMDGAGTSGSGWTAGPGLATVTFNWMEYQLVTATQSGITATMTGGTINSGIAMAVKSS